LNHLVITQAEELQTALISLCQNYMIFKILLVQYCQLSQFCKK